MENKKLELKGDERGSFFEVFKLGQGGQVSYSTTKPGIMRGNHYHLRKKEFFCVIDGMAKIKQRNIKTNEIDEVDVSGDTPEVVEMKIGWTHNITNIGSKEMKLLIWISEEYNSEDPDTFFENV